MSLNGFHAITNRVPNQSIVFWATSTPRQTWLSAEWPPQSDCEGDFVAALLAAAMLASGLRYLLPNNTLALAAADGWRRCPCCWSESRRRA